MKKPSKERKEAVGRSRQLILDCLDLNNVDIPAAITSMIDIIANCSAPCLNEEEFEQVVDTLRDSFKSYRKQVINEIG